MADNLIRRRPPAVGQFPNVANGVYPGTINSVAFKDGTNPYKDDEAQEYLHVGVSVVTPTGTVKMTKRVPYVESWSDKSNMYKMLDDLGCVPEEEEDFDFGTLVDMDVTVVVKNTTTKDGKTYSNIDTMMPRATTKTSTPARNKASAKVKESTEDSDFDPEDFSFDDEEE